MSLVPELTATIAIVTKDRCGELRTAVSSALAQTGAIDVLVIDDGSTDGTSAMIREEFPSVRVVQHAESLGLVVRRNEAARAARGDVIFSIDDDAEFRSPDTVDQTLREFRHPRVGAVAIPHVDTLSGHVVNKPAPTTEVWCVAQYVGTAHAVRRNVFAEMGGYREVMVHQGEEGDLCLRMLAAGYVTRLGAATPIQHHESPRRSFWRMEYYGRRNDVGQAWLHAPVLWLMPHLVVTTVYGLRQAIRTRRPAAHLQGLAAGWKSVLTGQLKRQPVSNAIYGLFRRLKTQGPLLLSDFEQQLPALPTRPS